MIYSNEHILYAIELRVLTLRYLGSLCMIQGRISNALKYFSIYPWKGFVTNPYVELPRDLISQMDKGMIRLLNSYIELSDCIFTNDEIRDIIAVCKKYDYNVIIHKNRISIRRKIDV